jgi:hypothetical protein
MRVLHEIPRTTNNIEGWNRAFNASCGVSNPNIAVVVNAMQNDGIISCGLLQKESRLKNVEYFEN